MWGEVKERRVCNLMAMTDTELPKLATPGYQLSDGFIGDLLAILKIYFKHRGALFRNSKDGGIREQRAVV